MSKERDEFAKDQWQKNQDNAKIPKDKQDINSKTSKDEIELNKSFFDKYFK